MYTPQQFERSTDLYANVYTSVNLTLPNLHGDPTRACDCVFRRTCALYKTVLLPPVPFARVGPVFYFTLFLERFTFETTVALRRVSLQTTESVLNDGKSHTQILIRNVKKMKCYDCARFVLFFNFFINSRPRGKYP